MKPIENFNKDNKKKNGFRSECKECQKIVLKKNYDENKNKIKEYTKKLRNQNIENKKFLCEKCGFIGESNYKLMEHNLTRKHKKIEQMTELEYFEYLNKLIQQEQKRANKKQLEN